MISTFLTQILASYFLRFLTSIPDCPRIADWFVSVPGKSVLDSDRDPEIGSLVATSDDGFCFL